ncbi:hypothetical protein [Lacinutrix salivirga]
MRRITFAILGIVTIAIFSFTTKKYFSDKNTKDEKVTMVKPQTLKKIYQ